MPYSYLVAPGVVVANTVTALPATAPKFVYLISAIDTESGVPTALTVDYTGTPAAGHILLQPVTTASRVAHWNFGSATTADSVLILFGYVEGEISAVA